MQKTAALVILAIIVIIIIAAAVLVSTGKPPSGTSGVGAGIGGAPGGYLVNCTPYYQQGLPTNGNLTCSNAKLSGDVLTFQTAQYNGTYPEVSFYLTSPSSSTYNITGFYINATSPTNVTWSRGQTLAVRFDLTPQQVTSLAKASAYGGGPALGWSWFTSNSTSATSGGGLFASINVKTG